MSLRINTDNIVAVLLDDGKWYEVLENSFDLDAYEYIDGYSDDCILPGGIEKLIPATGFSFVSKEEFRDKKLKKVLIEGPLTSVKAVKRV